MCQIKNLIYLFENWNIRFKSNKKVQRGIFSDDCLFWSYWHYTQSLNFIGQSQWCLEFLTFRYGSSSLFFGTVVSQHITVSWLIMTIVSARVAYSSYMGALERIKCSSFNLKVKKSQCFIIAASLVILELKLLAIRLYWNKIDGLAFSFNMTLYQSNCNF